MKTELTTMVMIQDPETGQVLVQDRKLSWKGLSFPGGHVDENESFHDCAVREILEETGLRIRGLTPCGIIHWNNSDTQDKYLVFLYKTTTFSGELITEMEEGSHFWMDIDKLRDALGESSANSFENYLPMFLGDHYIEGFGPWSKNEVYPRPLIYH